MKKSIAVLAWVFVGCMGFALPRAVANVGNESSDLAQSKTHFVENHGQIHDQNNAPNPEVRFLYNGNGLNVQLRKSGFSYDVWQTETGQNENAPEESKPQKFHFHRIDLDFENANPNYTVEKEGKSQDYLNFYGFSSAPEGVTRVHHYDKVVYKNVWKNIDMAFFITPNGFKYDIVVRPGGNPADAVFSVKGADDNAVVKLKLVEEVHSDYLFFFDEVIKEFEPQTEKKLITVLFKHNDASIIDVRQQTINNLELHFKPIGDFEKSLFNIVASTDPHEPFACVYFHKGYTFMFFSESELDFDSKKSVEIKITEDDLKFDTVYIASYYTMWSGVYKRVHRFNRDEH